MIIICMWCNKPFDHNEEFQMIWGDIPMHTKCFEELCHQQETEEENDRK